MANVPPSTDCHGQQQRQRPAVRPCHERPWLLRLRRDAAAGGRESLAPLPSQAAGHHLPRAGAGANRHQHPGAWGAALGGHDPRGAARASHCRHHEEPGAEVLRARPRPNLGHRLPRRWPGRDVELRHRQASVARLQHRPGRRLRHDPLWLSRAACARGALRSRCRRDLAGGALRADRLPVAVVDQDHHPGALRLHGKRHHGDHGGGGGGGERPALPAAGWLPPVLRVHALGARPALHRAGDVHALRRRGPDLQVGPLQRHPRPWCRPRGAHEQGADAAQGAGEARHHLPRLGVLPHCLRGGRGAAPAQRQHRRPAQRRTGRELGGGGVRLPGAHVRAVHRREPAAESARAQDLPGIAPGRRLHRSFATAAHEQEGRGAPVRAAGGAEEREARKDAAAGESRFGKSSRAGKSRDAQFSRRQVLSRQHAEHAAQAPHRAGAHLLARRRLRRRRFRRGVVGSALAEKRHAPAVGRAGSHGLGQHLRSVYAEAVRVPGDRLHRKGLREGRRDAHAACRAESAKYAVLCDSVRRREAQRWRIRGWCFRREEEPAKETDRDAGTERARAQQDGRG
eukprot:scaffold613_cov243-Pinguiococcus_pyrenoidosus.AAC.25